MSEPTPNTEPQEPLTEKELEKVSGGINPQPLPPGHNPPRD
jgi:bacteriocin-like protein